MTRRVATISKANVTTAWKSIANVTFNPSDFPTWNRGGVLLEIVAKLTHVEKNKSEGLALAISLNGDRDKWFSLGQQIQTQDWERDVYYITEDTRFKMPITLTRSDYAKNTKEISIDLLAAHSVGGKIAIKDHGGRVSSILAVVAHGLPT